MATIIRFPGTITPQVAAHSGDMTNAAFGFALVPKAKAHGSLEWARAVVKVKRRLLRQRRDGKKRADARRRKDNPKPKFVPDGAGYDGINSPTARQILRDKCPDFGPEEMKLARALKDYEARWKAYMEYGQRMEDEEGVTAAEEQLAAMREDWERAVHIMRANGEEPYE